MRGALTATGEHRSGTQHDRTGGLSAARFLIIIEDGGRASEKMQITSNPYQGKENGFYLPLARRMPPRRTGDRIPPRPTVPVWYRPLRDNTLR
ncbi:hypothetical protein ES705_37639 [subsurface metagenome]